MNESKKVEIDDPCSSLAWHLLKASQIKELETKAKALARDGSNLLRKMREDLLGLSHYCNDTGRNDMAHGDNAARSETSLS